eukprot:TRINITY_DN8580_c1_g2_i2.p1 TRINITY_DN8580_c1_g2~~TRINITY_DN8580_c1_g2_i2.p1  ORF type:complete len:544 (-),score=30.58 TRINITY_DN8580_c1_g2_i2:77-1708(-)
MSSPSEVFFVLCATSILCTALGIRAWECMHTVRVAKFCHRRSGSYLRKYLKVAILMDADEPADAIHVHAAELLHSEQLSVVRLVCFFFPVITSGLSLTRNSWLYVDEASSFSFSQGQHAVLCISSSAFIFVWISMKCNLLSTNKLADRLYVLACLLIDAMVAFSSNSRSDVENTIRFAVGLGVVFVFSRLDTHLVAFWNAVFIIVAGVKHTMTEADTMRGDMQTLLVVAPLMVFVAIQTFASHQIYTLTCESTLNQARAKESTVEQGALGKLLENACDVVIPLDASFSILDDAKNLSTMLMRDSSSSLKGRSIFDYFASEEEKERFQNSFKARSSTEEPRVSALNLHLRGDHGSQVNFESMGVAFRHVDGIERYLIGLRELSDFLPRSVRELQQRTVAPAEVAREDVSRNSASSNRGTPATIIGQPIASHGQHLIDASSSSSCSRRRRGHQLVSPLWNETSENGKRESLLGLIASWNCRVLPGCCSMHRTIPEVKRMLKRISTLQCDRTLHEPRNQCTLCGVLGSYEEDLFCSICHHDESVCL